MFEIVCMIKYRVCRVKYVTIAAICLYQIIKSHLCVRACVRMCLSFSVGFSFLPLLISFCAIQWHKNHLTIYYYQHCTISKWHYFYQVTFKWSAVKSRISVVFFSLRRIYRSLWNRCSLIDAWPFLFVRLNKKNPHL